MHFQLKAPRISLWNSCLCRQGAIPEPFMSAFCVALRPLVPVWPSDQGCSNVGAVTLRLSEELTWLRSSPLLQNDCTLTSSLNLCVVRYPVGREAGKYSAGVPRMNAAVLGISYCYAGVMFECQNFPQATAWCGRYSPAARVFIQTRTVTSWTCSLPEVYIFHSSVRSRVNSTCSLARLMYLQASAVE